MGGPCEKYVGAMGGSGPCFVRMLIREARIPMDTKEREAARTTRGTILPGKIMWWLALLVSMGALLGLHTYLDP